MALLNSDSGCKIWRKLSVCAVLATVLFMLSFTTANCKKTQKETFLDPMKYELQIYNKVNFPSKVSKNRTDTVFVVVTFLKSNKDQVKLLQGEINELAKDLKGMIPVGVVDCEEWEEFCKQDVVKGNKHGILIYPVNPLPPILYTGEIKKKLIANMAAAYIPSKVITATPSTLDSIMKENKMKTRAILFTNKNNPSAMYKALSNIFSDTIVLIFMNTSTPESAPVLKKYKGSKAPHLVVVRVEKEPEVYKGEMNFRKVHEWLNLFSETFITGADIKTTRASAPKPWLSQKIPELTKASHDSICFGKTGLCVIYLKEGKINDEEIEMLTTLKKRFKSELSDRGITYRWMHMDLSTEINFKNEFACEKLPSLTVLNPHKRIRFINIKKDPNPENIKELLDKIAGGDGRFTMITGNKIPEFHVPSPEKDEL